MCGVLSTECPCVTTESFKNTLASDNVFVWFFNDFLSLPCFPESLRFNQDTRLFEVESGQAQSVSRNIRLALLHLLSTCDPNERTHTPLIDNGYTVCCLDPKQGIEWVIRERFPFFVKSDLYFEYRFAKLLLQWNPELRVHKRAVRSAQSERTKGHAKSSNTFPRSASCFELDYPCPVSPPSQDPSHKRTEPLANTCEESCVNESTKSELEGLAATVVKQVLNAAIRIMGGLNPANTSTCFNKSEEQQINDPPASDHSAMSKVQLSLPAKDQVSQERDGLSRKACNEIGPGRNQWKTEQDVYSNCSNIGKRWRLFKEFLKGTQGEGLLHLWMDIERMKTTEVWERKNRCLALMRSRFLMSSSQTGLNTELLSRLGLSTSTRWTQEKLQTVQPQITHSLLFYWAARFWTSHRASDDADDSHNAPILTYFSSTSTIQTDLYGNETDSLYSPNPYLPTSPYTHSELCPSRGPLLATGQMERMIQALCVESGAGLYFTHFCEQSGSQLWENAIYFWSDLQNYHELFYQDGLDPYRVQREAQLLYATFLCSSAWRSLGVHEDMRRKVYDRLMPAFEELFDDIEEHVLNILLEPWSILVNRDEESFQHVPVQEEARRVDTQEYRELQSLYEELGSRRRQEQCESVLSADFPSTLKIPQLSESWSKVPSDFKGYRLGSLLRYRHEIGHFMKYLQNQNASIHLSCWLDLEQYRRIPQTNTVLRLERSAHLVNRYLNRKYFFGSDSPASIDEQHEILRLTGGLERLKLDCLTNAVVTAIQDIVRSHIEATWLPDFLSTAEFVQRQKDKPKPHATGRCSDNRKGRHRRRARREVWQCEGLWMSSSKEILSFRRVLLDPASCLQFQHFVSLKGDFLENDVLFWLEVQRYKDLCHSHSDQATIETKISTIISVFLNSSVPPALQIDIPHDQARTILENRHKLGPYIFREAQMSVFSELLRFWPEFQDLRSSVREEQLLPLLEQKRLKHRARIRRQRRKEEEEEEERRAQEQQHDDDEDEEDDEDDEDISDDERSDRKQAKTQSRPQFTSAQALTWSYSKYIAALKKEEILLRRKNQLDASSFTISDSSSCSVRSAGTVPSQKQLSVRSRTSSQQRHRHNKGVKPFNIK